LAETFRPARPDEIDAVARLGAHSFPNPARDRAWWRQFLGNGPHGGVEALWVAEEDGRLVGSTQLLELRQWIAGVAVPVTGVGAVAIAPTHRKRGLAKRMLTAAFQHARERGDVGSALYPFRISFYQGLGYGLAGEAHQYQVPPHLFPDDGAERLRVRLVEGEDDEAELRAVYHRALPLQTGQLERSARSWTKAWTGDQQAAVLYRGESGEAEGYALVRYRPDLPLDRRYLEVEERAWLTPAARRGIYGWLSSLGDQWREIAYRAHPDEHFGDRLAEPRLPALAAPGWGLWLAAATVMNGPMFRLLNVKAALEMRPLAPAEPLVLGLEVEDAQVPANHGPWRVRMEAGRMTAEPLAKGMHVDATLRAPVDVVSRIFIGATTVARAVEVGAAQVDRLDAIGTMDRAFAVPKPWMFDRF
jgi:predicted acetyltransferase